MPRWTLTARVSGKVEHERFEDLAAALAALERRGHELQGRADAEAVGGALMRRFEAHQQVSARLELHGPSVRAGVDVRGDGSSVPFTGRLRRREIEREDGESAYDALRRVVAG
jgi:hypothetical protein